MIYVKYVSMKENNNLWKQLVDIRYVINVLNNYIKKIMLKNAQYVDKKIGFNLINEFS